MMSNLSTTIPTAQKPISHRRDSQVMLSRVANSLYWMSRYIERAENMARLLDVNLQLMLDFADLNDQQLKEHWLPILCSAGDEETFFKLYDRADSESVTEFLTFREENPNSIISCLFTARVNARQVRDQISLEMFEALNECYLFLKSKNSREIWQSGAHDFYEQIKKYSHLFQGLTASTFTRGEGYEFINLGKFLERADKTTRILDIKYHILLPSVADVGGAVDAALAVAEDLHMAVGGGHVPTAIGDLHVVVDLDDIGGDARWHRDSKHQSWLELLDQRPAN